MLELTIPTRLRNSRQSVRPYVSPSMEISPAVSAMYPVRVLSNEVLPEPLAPRIAQCCPGSTLQSIDSRITASRSTLSFDTAITAGRFGVAARRPFRCAVVDTGARECAVDLRMATDDTLVNESVLGKESLHRPNASLRTFDLQEVRSSCD